MNEEEPVYFYKLMLTESQFETLKTAVISCLIQSAHDEECKNIASGLTAAVWVAQKEAIE